MKAAGGGPFLALHPLWALGLDPLSTVVGQGGVGG